MRACRRFFLISFVSLSLAALFSACAPSPAPKLPDPLPTTRPDSRPGSHPALQIIAQSDNLDFTENDELFDEMESSMLDLLNNINATPLK